MNLRWQLELSSSKCLHQVLSRTQGFFILTSVGHICWESLSTNISLFCHRLPPHVQLSLSQTLPFTTSYQHTPTLIKSVLPFWLLRPFSSYQYFHNRKYSLSLTLEHVFVSFKGIFVSGEQLSLSLFRLPRCVRWCLRLSTTSHIFKRRLETI